MGEEPSVDVSAGNHDLGDTNSRLKQELSQPFSRAVEEDNKVEVEAVTHENNLEDLNTFGESDE